MASGDRDGARRDFHSLGEAYPSELIWQKTGPETNMKEVDFFNEEEINKKRSPGGRVAQNVSKAKRTLSCKRKTRHVTMSSGGWRKPLTAGADCDTANKENVMARAEGAQQGAPHNDHYRLPLTSTETSTIEEAGSTYSNCFTELSKDHYTVTHVLFGRNLRLNVALTLWRRNASELVAYLIRIQDQGVFIDCLPIITKSLQDESTSMSIGCCVDLLPLVKTVLSSKYEEHLIVGLQWIQSILTKWWPELSANGRRVCGSSAEDRNVQAMKEQLQEVWKQGRQLSLVPGTTGEIAKAIESYVSQLC